MIKAKHIKISALALVISLSLAGAPAIAHQNRVSAVTANDTSKTSDDASETEIRKKGRALADDMRKQHQSSAKVKTSEQRKTTCEAHKKGLTKKFERIVANSEKIKKHIDDVMAKGQDFQQENNLPVADFNTLVETALTAQTAAAESITALKEVTPTLDCNNVSVANDVATFKAAAQDTRDKLKDYRKAVKAILKALHEAKTAEGSGDSGENTEGGAQ